jgi:hypothetical protein
MLSRLLIPGVVALLLLAGCQAEPDVELEDALAAIPGVAVVDVDAERVKATLDDDIAAADAQTAILELRSQAVAGHELGGDVELVIVLNAAERDFGGAAPWQVYSYAKWSTGAVAAEGFDQQAAFFASLADWETLTTTPAQILRLKFEVTGVTSVVPTPDPAETAEPTETDEPVEEPTVQVVEVLLDQPFPTENVPADVEALITELDALWVASGGLPEGIAIS